MSATAIRGSRRTLLLIVATFLAPVATAFLLYYAGEWRPRDAVNHGELIVPPRPLPESSLSTPGGGSTAPRFLHDTWSLLYVGSGSCDAPCRLALYQTRQVRLALGQRMDRVQRVFLFTGSCCEQPFFDTEHAGLVTASVDSEAGRRLLKSFPHANRALPPGGRIYVVDPLGNLMMSYAPETAPQGMLEDLKRLLRLSHIG